jgi:hypothetical protein
MNTLYEKLKPELKEVIENQHDKYPSLVSNVISSLKENYLWSHLTVGQARDIIYFTDISYAQMSSYDWSYGEKFFVDNE